MPEDMDVISDLGGEQLPSGAEPSLDAELEVPQPPAISPRLDRRISGLVNRHNVLEERLNTLESTFPHKGITGTDGAVRPPNFEWLNEPDKYIDGRVESMLKSRESAYFDNIGLKSFMKIAAQEKVDPLDLRDELITVSAKYGVDTGNALNDIIISYKLWRMDKMQSFNGADKENLRQEKLSQTAGMTGGVGVSGGGGLTAEALANMPQEEFNKLMAENEGRVKGVLLSAK